MSEFRASSRRLLRRVGEVGGGNHDAGVEAAARTVLAHDLREYDRSGRPDGLRIAPCREKGTDLAQSDPLEREADRLSSVAASESDVRLGLKTLQALGRYAGVAQDGVHLRDHVLGGALGGGDHLALRPEVGPLAQVCGDLS